MDSLPADDTQTALVRPFIGRALSAVDGGDDQHNAPRVRAYAMTGGRVRADVHLEFETMLQTTAGGGEALAGSKFERAGILRLCHSEPLSVAELSAMLHVPIGVVRVVAGDLLGESLLQSFQPSTNVADDVLLITRLIAGVRAL